MTNSSPIAPQVKGGDCDAWIKAGWGEHLIPLMVGPASERKRPDTRNWQNPDRSFVTVLPAKCAAGAGLGVRTAANPSVDIEDSPHAGALRQAVEDFVGVQCSWRTRPGSNSTATLLRLDDPFGVTVKKMAIYEQGAVKPLVEILGMGAQVMVSGTHPSGDELVWTEGVPERDKLWGGEASQFQDLLNHLQATLEDLGLTNLRVTGHSLVPGQQGSGDEQISIEDARDLIGLLDTNALDYDEWIRVCLALKGATDGAVEARDLWLEFSDKYEGQVTKDAGYVWDTASPTQIGAGALRQLVELKNKEGLAALKVEKAKAEFDEIPDTEDLSKRTVNPLTNKPRWLAKKVMQRALMMQRSQQNTDQGLGTWRDFKLRAKSLKIPPALIPGWARAGEGHGVIGAPGANKSLLTLHHALCGAWGIHPRDPKIKTEPCIVIANWGEDGEAQIAARALAIETHYAGGNMPDTAQLRFYSGDPLQLVEIGDRRMEKTITFGLHALCDILEQVIAEHIESGGIGPGVVLIFDMLRHSFDGDENVRWQIDVIFRVWKAIMICVEEAGGPPTATIYTHHATKQASRGQASDKGFNAAGSVGIDGNSRMMTEASRQSLHSPIVWSERTKDNYGATGFKEWWERVEVASPLGGTSVWLKPIDERVDVDDVVEQVHALLCRESALVVRGGKGTRAPQGHHKKFGDLVAETGIATDEIVRQVFEAGAEAGAWTLGEVQKGGVRSASGVVVNRAWALPAID